jgi:hypothetical protein
MTILIAEADDDGPARGYAVFRRTDGWAEDRPTGVVRLVYAPSEFPNSATYDDVKDMTPDVGKG